MAQMILICGRVCAGKTTYAKRLAQELHAVRLNADELMKPLFGEYLGDRHEEVLCQVTDLLLEKAAECYACGVTVILDLGFWQRSMRERANRFLKKREFAPHGIISGWERKSGAGGLQSGTRRFWLPAPGLII